MRNLCRVESCGRFVNSNGFCISHIHRLKKYGNVYESFPICGNYYSYPEYSNYKGMVDRCSPKCLNRKHYYDKGIAVCSEWKGRNGFMNFYLDMGAKPSTKHSIERIDSNKGYYKGNCKWGTYIEQSNNTSRNRFITYKGRTLSMARWAAELGMHRHTIKTRLNAGWSIEKTLTVKPGHGNRWLNYRSGE